MITGHQCCGHHAYIHIYINRSPPSERPQWRSTWLSNCWCTARCNGHANLVLPAGCTTQWAHRLVGPHARCRAPAQHHRYVFARRAGALYCRKILYQTAVLLGMRAQVRDSAGDINVLCIHAELQGAGVPSSAATDAAVLGRTQQLLQLEWLYQVVALDELTCSE